MAFLRTVKLLLQVNQSVLIITIEEIHNICSKEKLNKHSLSRSEVLQYKDNELWRNKVKRNIQTFAIVSGGLIFVLHLKEGAYIFYL